MRLTSGLDKPKVQDRYIAFFYAVYERANAAAEAAA